MPKRVLITVNILCGYSGSELHTISIAEQFIKKGYEVVIATYHARYPMLGEALKVGAQVVTITDSTLPFDHYDIFFAQHCAPTNNIIITNDFTFDKLVCVSLGAQDLHGTLPVFFDKADMLVFCSGETKEIRLKEISDYPEEHTFIFPNYADDELLRYASDTYETGTPDLQRVAIVSNHIPQELLDFKRIATESGYTVDCFGTGGDDYCSVRIDGKTLSGYDLVVTIGRTVQYCFAMGIPVYCYDWLGGPGFIQEDTFETSAYYNFSGRCCRTKRTGEELFEDMVARYEKGLRTVRYLKEKARERFYLPAIFDAFLHKLCSEQSQTKTLNDTFSQVEKNYIAALSRELYVLRAYKSAYTTFYFDDGTGFTAENSTSFQTIYRTAITLEVPVPEGVTLIRFDPAEDFCACEIKEVLIDGKPYHETALISDFYVLENNKTAFLTSDPQYVIDIEKHGPCKELSVTFVLFETEPPIAQLKNSIANLEQSQREAHERQIALEQNLREAHENRIALEQSLQESDESRIALEKSLLEAHEHQMALEQSLREENERSAWFSDSLDAVLNSRSWKITQPLRTIKALTLKRKVD